LEKIVRVVRGRGSAAALTTGPVYSAPCWDVKTGPGAAPLSEDWNVIEICQPNPAAVGLDGDSYLEFLYPSYDGRVHAHWLDKTEHHDWPYSVCKPSEGVFRFAAEPAVADLDNDDHAEVIFGSWPALMAQSLEGPLGEWGAA
jgi:hypothetical protein